jgi:hypothetical protein
MKTIRIVVTERIAKYLKNRNIQEIFALGLQSYWDREDEEREADRQAKRMSALDIEQKYNLSRR